MFSVDDYRWLNSPEARGHWSSLLHAELPSEAAILKWLRTKLPTPRASLLMEQFQLLPIAQRKFSDPHLWFWTRQLLEQSSDQDTAIETALDFPAGGTVHDICVGAGADCVAIANRPCNVIAYDNSPIACALARHNLDSHRLDTPVHEATAESIAIPSGSFIHIDPDRRPSGHRTTHLEWISPPWNTMQRLLAMAKGMSLKLAPGFRLAPYRTQDSESPNPQSIRYLSKQGSVRQQRWYWGIERWPSESTVLSMFLNQPAVERTSQFMAQREHSTLEQNSRTEGNWFHEWYPYHDANPGDSPHTPITSQLLEYVGDYDPVVRAAQLAPAFSVRYGWQLIENESGYLTSITNLPHPMVRWFRVIDRLPMDQKRLKSYSRTVKVGNWELKSRGIEIDLDATRKILATDSASKDRCTILFTCIEKRRFAVVCREV
ncbi:MAG: class I SAM-dependent methyltransferase [Pirellula sp.]